MVKNVLNQGDPPGVFFRGQNDRIVRLAPDGARPEWVGGEAGNQVPVHVGYHVPEQLIIHFIRFEEVEKGCCDVRDLIQDGLTCMSLQVEEFRHMAPGDNEGIALEELVPVEEDMARLQLSDAEVGFVMPFCAHGAGLHAKTI